MIFKYTFSKHMGFTNNKLHLVGKMPSVHCLSELERFVASKFTSIKSCIILLQLSKRTLFEFEYITKNTPTHTVSVGLVPEKL